jgi:hypothetical protein
MFNCRFHRAAFIFIGNIALADLVLVIVEIIAIQLQLKTNSMQDELFQSHFTLDSEQARKLDQQRIRACRYYIQGRVSHRTCQ